MKFRRIRPGLYESKDGHFQIEHLDEAAEWYPGNDYYNQWRIRQDDKTWLYHFNTLQDAKGAIKSELQTSE